MSFLDSLSCWAWGLGRFVFLVLVTQDNLAGCFESCIEGGEFSGIFRDRMGMELLKGIRCDGGGSAGTHRPYDPKWDKM
jgi:hypothetical protein